MSRIDALTLRQLRALRAVVAKGTLTAAAHDLGLSPPPFTARSARWRI
ncbi:helix-turn-helix domain-containing protein [Paracoccus cavernae]